MVASLVIVAVMVLSTAAVVHSHVGRNSGDESHCPLCMAVHSAKHAVAQAALVLFGSSAPVAFVADRPVLAPDVAQLLLIHGRAPPAI
jgi:hypothetical protein